MVIGPDKVVRLRYKLSNEAGEMLEDGSSAEPVALPCSMNQRVRLRVKTGDREIVYVPEGREVENEVGRCAF